MAPQPTSKIEELKARLQLEPTSRLFFPLAEELRKAGRAEEAERVLREGIGRNPSYLSAWVSLGRVLAQRDNHAEAVDAFGRALQLDPENIVAARMAGESYLKLGDKVEAIKKFKLVHAFLPTDQDIQAQIESLERDLNPDRYVRPISVGDAAAEFNVLGEEGLVIERDEDLPETRVLPIVKSPEATEAADQPGTDLAADTSAFLQQAFAPEVPEAAAAKEQDPAPFSSEPVFDMADSAPLTWETEPDPAAEHAGEPEAATAVYEPSPPAPSESLLVMEAEPAYEAPPVEEPITEVGPEDAQPLATPERAGRGAAVHRLQNWLGKMRRDHGQRL